MPASTMSAAIYARVSSEQQADAGTVASQVEALKHRVVDDGLLVDAALCFIDEGYSGATLVRPALERLRDLVATGAIDRLYVHCPDRLARKYAYQVLLVDELHRSGPRELPQAAPKGPSVRQLQADPSDDQDGRQPLRTQPQALGHRKYHYAIGHDPAEAPAHAKLVEK